MKPGILSRMFRAHPLPALRLFGRPVRADDMKAVDPEPAHPEVVVLRVVPTELEPDAQDQWSAFGIVRRGDEKRQSHSRASELRHSGPTLLPYDTQRVDPDVASDASAYRPVCAHEGLNEYSAPSEMPTALRHVRQGVLMNKQESAVADTDAIIAAFSTSLEQTTADIRAISIPALTAAEIIANALAHPMIERMEAARTGTAKRDSKGRFLKRTTNAPQV